MLVRYWGLHSLKSKIALAVSTDIPITREQIIVKHILLLIYLLKISQVHESRDHSRTICCKSHCKISCNDKTNLATMIVLLYAWYCSCKHESDGATDSHELGLVCMVVLLQTWEWWCNRFARIRLIKIYRATKSEFWVCTKHFRSHEPRQNGWYIATALANKRGWFLRQSNLSCRMQSHLLVRQVWQTH